MPEWLVLVRHYLNQLLLYYIHLPQCIDRIHHSPESCTNEGGIRLLGGMQTYEGRVEICAGGQWSTVCDDFWGSLDAQVTCRQLGYSTEGESIIIII